jgi:rhodanese-related sulfurtransferase
VDVPHIDVTELAARQTAGVPVFDVRHADEYEQAHVPGAVLIPLDELVERVDEIPTTGQVVLICASGGRSYRAGEWLRSRGVDAVNVAGGTIAWIDAGEQVATGPEPG